SENCFWFHWNVRWGSRCRDAERWRWRYRNVAPSCRRRIHVALRTLCTRLAHPSSGSWIFTSAALSERNGVRFLFADVCASGEAVTVCGGEVCRAGLVRAVDCASFVTAWESSAALRF